MKNPEETLDALEVGDKIRLQLQSERSSWYEGEVIGRVEKGVEIELDEKIDLNRRTRAVSGLCVEFDKSVNPSLPIITRDGTAYVDYPVVSLVCE